MLLKGRDRRRRGVCFRRDAVEGWLQHKKWVEGDGVAGGEPSASEGRVGQEGGNELCCCDARGSPFLLPSFLAQVPARCGIPRVLPGFTRFHPAPASVRCRTQLPFARLPAQPATLHPLSSPPSHPQGRPPHQHSAPVLPHRAQRRPLPRHRRLLAGCGGSNGTAGRWVSSFAVRISLGVHEQ